MRIGRAGGVAGGRPLDTSAVATSSAAVAVEDIRCGPSTTLIGGPQVVARTGASVSRSETGAVIDRLRARPSSTTAGAAPQLTWTGPADRAGAPVRSNPRSAIGTTPPARIARRKVSVTWSVRTGRNDPDPVSERRSPAAVVSSTAATPVQSAPVSPLIVAIRPSASVSRGAWSPEAGSQAVVGSPSYAAPGRAAGSVVIREVPSAR